MEHRDLIRYFVFVSLLILSISQTTAITINNTIIHSYGLDSNFTIGNKEWVLDELVTDTDYIFIVNLTSSNPLEVSNESLTFNYTGTNQHYTGTQVPYFIFSNNHEKTIRSDISNNMLGLTSIDVFQCNDTEVYYKPASGSWTLINESNIDCDNNRMEIPLQTLNDGDNRIRLISDYTLNDCGNSTAGNLYLSVYHEDLLSGIDQSNIKGTIFYWDNYWYNVNKSISGKNYSFDETVYLNNTLSGVIDNYISPSDEGGASSSNIYNKFTVDTTSIISAFGNYGSVTACTGINISIYKDCTATCDCSGGSILAEKTATASGYYFSVAFDLSDYNQILIPNNNYCLRQEKTSSCYPKRDSDELETYNGNIINFVDTPVRSKWQINASGVLQNSVQFCLDSLTGNVTAEAIIQYKGGTDGFNDWWYLYNQTISSYPISIKMYNFNDTSMASLLKITTRNKEDYSYLTGINLWLERYYPAENLWRNVQQDRTDEFGKAVFHVKEDSTIYRIRFLDEKYRYLKMTDNIKFNCDAGICDITYLLNEYSPPSSITGLSVNYTYDSTTKMLNLKWVDTTGNTAYLKWNVRKETMAGTTDICSSTYYTASGTANCNLTSYTNEVFIYVESDDQVLISEWVDMNKTGIGSILSFGEQAIWTFLIMLAIIGFGLISPAIAVISGIIGLIVILFLGIFTPITVTFVTIAVIVGFIIAMRLRR